MKTTLHLIIYLLSFPVFSQSIEFTPEEKEWIKNHPVIEFGYEAQYCPYEIYEEGQFKGVAGDFILRIEEATGIDLVPIKDISWQETLDGLKSDAVKMAPAISPTKAREQYMVFTKPYLQDPYVIVCDSDAGYVGSVEDLNNKTVVIPNGYTTDSILREKCPDVKVVHKSSVEECLRAVTFGQADAYIGNLGVINYFIFQKGYTNLRVVAPFGKKDVQLSMGFSKDWVVFRDICQKVLDGISVHERSEIRKKWIVQTEESKGISSAVLNWIIGIIATLLLIIALIYFWNRSLQKQIREKELAQQTLKESYAKIQQQNEEKKVLLQEIHHRVKNNLQITSSMLRLQKDKSDSADVQRSLKDAIDRIQSISLVHEKIYRSESLDSVNPKSYINSLGKEILQSFSVNESVDLVVESESEKVSLKKMIPIALVLNELITNSVKHGFRNKENGTIQISFVQNEHALTIMYSDDGEWLDDANSHSFGTSLIETFTEQLEGKFDFSKENGTRYNFVFPVG